MNYEAKKLINKIRNIDHEIYYYERVYKNCRKLKTLKLRKRVLQNQLLVLK